MPVCCSLAHICSSSLHPLSLSLCLLFILRTGFGGCLHILCLSCCTGLASACTCKRYISALCICTYLAPALHSLAFTASCMHLEGISLRLPSPLTLLCTLWCMERCPVTVFSLFPHTSAQFHICCSVSTKQITQACSLLHMFFLLQTLAYLSLLCALLQNPSVSPSFSHLPSVSCHTTLSSSVSALHAFPLSHIFAQICTL